MAYLTAYCGLLVGSTYCIVSGALIQRFLDLNYRKTVSQHVAQQINAMVTKLREMECIRNATNAYLTSHSKDARIAPR
ncbi:hypothetical protein AC249_AIPGENE13663 [Exaiptasia diaphana]|nr:hypothetical protein AC249_AIPGENE13663 [Exaiptasia diaphana]